MPSHTQDLETQDRLTKNIKDLLWLNTYADGKDIKASDALAALEVCTCILAAISRLSPTPHIAPFSQITPFPPPHHLLGASQCLVLAF